MNLKKKIQSGVATALLGIALIAGGTFAYFSDTTEQTNTFASGTIDLDVDPTVQIPMKNLKPGDWMPRNFELQNNGSLDIGYVDLNTDYSVYTVDENGHHHGVSSETADEFAKQLYVEFLYNTSSEEDYEVLFEVSLYDLATMTPDDLATKIDIEEELIRDGYWTIDWFWFIPIKKWIEAEYGEVEIEETGIAKGEKADFNVQFRFNDTDERQNDLQGLNLDLEWTFEGYQTEGEER